MRRVGRRRDATGMPGRVGRRNLAHSHGRHGAHGAAASTLSTSFQESTGLDLAGHLGREQTYAKVARQFWWPKMQDAVRSWVSACQDCGGRKARPRHVPPLWSLRVGELCDPAGPLPESRGGNRYVVAVVEYVSKYVVAVPVANRNAETAARVLVESVIYKFGPFRELLTDEASELTGSVIEKLVGLVRRGRARPFPTAQTCLGLSNGST